MEEADGEEGMENMAQIAASADAKLKTAFRACDAIREGLLTEFSYSDLPIDIRPISKGQPSFQGCFVRGVDHSAGASFAFILGSFSAEDSDEYTEHYLYCGARKKKNSHAVEASPHPSQVTSFNRLTDAGGNYSWTANGLGHFWCTADACHGDFNFPDKSSLSFHCDDHVRWNDNHDMEGPEGWLGRVPLLPCRYSVHSIGSRCKYSFRMAGKNPFASAGSGFAHVESNYGTFFPKGWVWAQGIAANNSASFCMTSGHFSVGGLTPMMTVLNLRRACGTRVIMRSIDMDRIRYRIDGVNKALLLRCSSPLSGVNVRVVIRWPENCPGHRIKVPTAKGFSRSPGCLETYAAEAEVTYEDDQCEEKYVFPMTTFEFGGEFINALHESHSEISSSDSPQE